MREFNHIKGSTLFNLMEMYECEDYYGKARINKIISLIYGMTLPDLKEYVSKKDLIIENE